MRFYTFLSIIVLVTILCTATIMQTPAQVSADDPVVTFPDPGLNTAVRNAINPNGDIHQSDLDGLTNLDASWGQIVDLTGIEHCSNLNVLNLGNNRINDISALSNLTNLQELSLWNNQISDVSALADLTNLTLLVLSQNQISNISALSGLTNLNKLNLGGNEISDISALASLPNLTMLILYNNNISNLSELSGFNNLTDLSLSANQISDISALANLYNLSDLSLDSNQISNITDLLGLTNLNYLRLGNNQVSNISALSGLTNLTQLNLSNNQISDIQSLINNYGLGTGDWVNLRDNPLNSISLDSYIPELEARGAFVQFLTATSPTSTPACDQGYSGRVVWDSNSSPAPGTDIDFDGQSGQHAITGSDGSYSCLVYGCMTSRVITATNGNCSATTTATWSGELPTLRLICPSTPAPEVTPTHNSSNGVTSTGLIIEIAVGVVVVLTITAFVLVRRRQTGK